MPPPPNLPPRGILRLATELECCPVGVIAAAARGVGECLCVAVTLPGGAPTAEHLRWAAAAYEAVATVAPRLDVRLLFSCAGWTEAEVDALQQRDHAAPLSAEQLRLQPGGGDVRRLPRESAAPPVEQPPRSLFAALRLLFSRGPAALLRALLCVPDVADVHQVIAGPAPPYDVAVVAGTFDRLHAGHRLLLTSAALVATRSLYIGVTGAALTKHKKLAGLLEAQAVREAAAAELCRATRPGLTVITGELTDPMRGIDGQPEVDAMVVSRETAGRAARLNVAKAAARALAFLFPPCREALRKRMHGLAPYGLVVVGLVGADREGPKLSSTALREADDSAAAAAAASGSQRTR